MPIYEYRCGSCDAEFEELVRSEEGARSVACPSCGSGAVSRRLSVFAAHDDTGGRTPTNPPVTPCGRCGDPRGSCSL